MRFISPALLLLVAACAAPPASPPQAPLAAFSSASQMADAASAFLGMLSDSERALALQPADADSLRGAWSNLPSMFVERGGFRLGDMSDAQRRALHDLMRASSSSQGYQKLAGLIRLDGVLKAEASEAVAAGTRRLPPELIESWDSRNYWVTVFGEPSASGTWGWQLSGHHLAANFTVVDGQVAFTPLFLGAEPNEIQAGLEAGWRALSHEGERGWELVHSLDAERAAAAVLSGEVPDDIFTGPGRKGALGEYEGLTADRLDEGQQMLLWALIREFAANVDHDAAAAQLAEIERDGLASLHFAWIGPTDDPSGRYYYRVHGPSVLIEYVVEEGVGGAAANHVHAIMRDPGNDYGEDWLGRHYEEHHVRIR